MKEANKPLNETMRLKKLESYEILDTEVEKRFDDFAYLASVICDTPIALISLVDNARQWFKAKVGLEVSETPRSVSFCSHAIVSDDDVFVVEDSNKDERFHDNPLVKGDPKVVFYAGAPLVTVDGFKLGTLCTIDSQPRKLSHCQKKALRILADKIIEQFDLRIEAKYRANQTKGLKQYAEMLSVLHVLNGKKFETEEELFKAYLESGKHVFNLDLGIVSQIGKSVYLVKGLVAPEGAELAVGAKLDLNNTYCERVIKEKRTIVYRNAGTHEYMRNHPAYLSAKLESYISTPIWVNGEVYGTLNFSSPAIRDREFEYFEINYIELVSQALGKRIEEFRAHPAPSVVEVVQAKTPAEVDDAYRKILVVEDNEVNRVLVEKFLKDCPYELVFANDGKEAISQYQSQSFDLVLMDIQMPKMDGIEATLWIRNYEKEKGVSVPIIALTAHAMAEEVNKCLDSGCTAHVSKPVVKRDLINAIEIELGKLE